VNDDDGDDDKNNNNMTLSGRSHMGCDGSFIWNVIVSFTTANSYLEVFFSRVGGI